MVVFVCGGDYVAGNIKFSPEEGRAMASTIITKRDSIQGEIDDLSNLILGQLCENWEGSASRKYSEQYTELRNQVMNGFLTMLGDLSQQLNDIVDAMESADEQIASQIQMM